ncbi:antitoxin ParD1/3/4 [Nitrosospira sp. Nl5]|uniref:ribbon-helix-helix domain-containing protein n=1 Tax=Nitrosospira sp. Nl5 TaxID=200120 RepID=UPI00088C84A7|nr:ribbon-helix-helix protein, CopG family [Nitrosospira sp. Nl5]SCY28568.1 antitoxin ParD1/3/4 [Nitrosospira sp. Nl5]
MAELERLTITMPGEMVAVVKAAVAEGDYASTSEVVREALRDWKIKRAIQHEEIAALKADIDKGLADVAAGRLTEFNADRIVERGSKLLAARKPSA